MDSSKDIPLYQFRFPHKDAIPFEIIRIKQSPPSAWSPKPKGVDFSKPNRVNFYEILWITSGSGTRYIDFKGYPIQPYTFFCLTPGQVHFSDVREPIAGYVILFIEEFLSLGPLEQGFVRDLDFFHRVDYDPVIYLNDQEAQSFQVTLDALMAEFEQEQFGRAIAIQSRLRLLLIQLL